MDISTPEYELVEIGLDIDSFMERIQQHNATVYFHNLKWDGRFILDWLLKHDFYHVNIQTLSAPETFKTLISDMGQFYSITVRWANGHSVEFRDSLKKLPMSVKNVAKAFKLEVSKGDIDYEAYRPIGHKLTPEEEDYLRRDVVIVAKAMNEVIAAGMKKLTVASDSMAEYKTLTGNDNFDRLFPVLSETIDQEIRRSYRGGFTYADPRFAKKLNGPGIVLDVNSLYPSVMRYRVLPYGEPDFVSGFVEPTKARPLAIFSITFTAKLKPNHIPCIQIKGHSMFVGTEYLTEIKEPTTLMVTSVDWELYNLHYDIDVISYGGGWLFRGVEGLFDNYIDKWSEIKANETGGKREIAKLHLNSLYGKFASNPNVTPKIPVLEDGIVKLKRGKDETRPPVYTAVGSFITAYARELTITSAQENYETFAYADTDSLHLLTTSIPTTLEVHPTKLGAWKFEYGFENSFYIRPKAYLERLPGIEEFCDDHDCKIRHNYVTKIAGLPENVSNKIGFEDLIDGKVFEGKMNPKAVPGGVILKKVPFELKL